MFVYIEHRSIMSGLICRFADWCACWWKFFELPGTNNTVVNCRSVVNQRHAYPQSHLNYNIIHTQTDKINYFVINWHLKAIGISFPISGIEIALYFEENSYHFSYNVKSCWNNQCYKIKQGLSLQPWVIYIILNFFYG